MDILEFCASPSTGIKGDSDVRLRFGMQIVDDEDAKSELFSLSVIAMPKGLSETNWGLDTRIIF